MKIAVVIQRFGEGIVGGSEYYALKLLEKLSLKHKITVYTTKAKNYTNWKNEYENNSETIGRISIKRFPTIKERAMKLFNKHSDEFFKKSKKTLKEEKLWIEEQGPLSPELISSIEKEQDNYDVFIFFTYLYYPTVFGINVIKKPKILISTAHDELPLYLKIMENVFYKPDAILFLTEEEKELIEKLFPKKDQIREVIGSIGIEPPSKINEKKFIKKYTPIIPYSIYIGRIDEGKGVDFLIRNFLIFTKSTFSQLLIAGKLNMELPSDFRIKYTGFISEKEKWEALKGAIVYVHPSMYESLSITVLEAMSVGTPVLVNGNSSVLLGHIKKSNGGLYYKDRYEFIEALKFLHENKKLREELGENGKNYVKENYSWNKILEKFDEVLKKVVKI